MLAQRYRKYCSLSTKKEIIETIAIVRLHICQGFMGFTSVFTPRLFSNVSYSWTRTTMTKTSGQILCHIDTMLNTKTDINTSAMLVLDSFAWLSLRLSLRFLFVLKKLSFTPVFLKLSYNQNHIMEINVTDS